ncbi:hypothetical protein ACFLZZ_01090 [Nanoarchaeota archaeon]
MKLQKRFLREVNGKKYFKWIVNLPPESIEKAQLKEGDELEAETKKGEIRLRKK